MLRSAIRTHPDVVHALASEPAVGVGSGRQVVTLHDVFPWLRPGRGIRAPAAAAYLRIQAARLRRCAAVITPSRAVHDQAVDVIGIDPGRITVIAEGVDPVFRPAPAAEGGVLPEEVAGVGGAYVVWVGSLRSHDPRKALDVLVAALGRLARAGAALHLVLVGALGAEAERVARRAHQAEVRATLAGFVDDTALANLLRGAAVAVLPSLDEGFGLPALEAMACGAPLVVSRAGNLPDLVGDAAVVVDPGDAASLAAGLAQVLADPGLAERLRAAGPRRAAEFTWHRTARETLAVYRRIAAGMAPPSRRRGGAR